MPRKSKYQVALKDDVAWDLFKYTTDCPGNNIPVVIKTVIPKLSEAISKFDYPNAEDLSRHLTLCSWTTLSLLSMAEIDSQSCNYENFEKEFLRKRVEREYQRVLTLLISHYKSHDSFIQDFLAFNDISDVWYNERAALYLLSSLPHKVIYVDELVTHLCKILPDEYSKQNNKKVSNIVDITSQLLTQKGWKTTSSGSQACLESLLLLYETVYDENYQSDENKLEEILKWMRYFVEKITQPEHISDTIDLLSVWLYFHVENVNEVINFGTLLFYSCYLFHPSIISVSLKHFFQDIILCMINSNDISVVSLGYDILITLTDRNNNKTLLQNPVIYNEDVILQFKLKDRRRTSIYENLFAFDEFVYMMDSIHKVVLNSIKRFMDRKPIARKVNTLISLLALEGCDSAQGLITIISIALSIQDSILSITRVIPERSTRDSINPLNPHAVFYHGCIASCFSLLSSTNTGDLDLFRSYVKSVIDLRNDSAPYLLPSIDPVPFLDYYIYEMDKSLYFDMDQVQGAIENSWAVLTNNKELLNNIKIPRSNVLLEKYVDIKLLDTFDAYKAEEMRSRTERDDVEETPEKESEDVNLDETETVFTDLESIRYSAAFTEPFERFIFPNLYYTYVETNND